MNSGLDRQTEERVWGQKLNGMSKGYGAIKNPRVLVGQQIIQNG